MATNNAINTGKPIEVSNGGTGVSSLTNNGVVIGQGSSSLTTTAVGAADTVLVGNGGSPTFTTVPNAALTNSSVTINNGNNITVTGSPLSLGGVASVAVSGTTDHAVQVGNASGSLTSLSLGTNGQVLVGSTGADPSFVTPTAGTGLTLTSNATTLQYALSTPVSVSNGGTSSTSLTQYNVLIGNNTSAIATVAPSATSGVPLISQGAAANPTFGTAVVAGGGTGATSFTAYSVICGGTTSTGALQNVSGVGTSGQVLTSNGASTLPTLS